MHDFTPRKTYCKSFAVQPGSGDGFTIRQFFKSALCAALLLFIFSSAFSAKADLVAVAWQDKPTVTGKVTDSVGAALPGVTVRLKSNLSIGTSTDINGLFVLEAPQNATLVITYVGYVTREVAVNGRGTVNVTLVESKANLDEVVVVGFGTQKKVDMIGAVTSVKVSELKVPSSNLTTALAGRVAGVIAYQRSGEPGQDNADFFIRGVTSFGTGKVNPLVLIDGVELSVTELARLRPDDIESFSIMKDATATAVYGARGANGVIYVTTKQGKEGKAKISLRAENSISMPTSNVELADPVTYMKLYNEASIARNPFGEPLYSQEKIDATAEGLYPLLYPATNWRETLFKKFTNTHRYNMNVSGGGKVARYYVAGSFAQDNGILKVERRNNFNNNIDLKTYTLRANVNIDLTKSTELIVRVNGNFDDYNGPIDGGAALYNRVINSSPVEFPAYYPVDEEHKFIKHIMFGGLANRTFLNPYADMVKGYKDYTRSLMLAQLEAKQDLSFITKGLKFRTMMNTNRISRFDIVRSYDPFFYEKSFINKQTGEYSIDVFNENSGSEYLDFSMPVKDQSAAFYIETALNYSRTFLEKHSFSSMLVNIMRSSLNANASSLQLSLPSRNVGLSGRTTYSYNSRYFFEFNFGYNGSERFYQDKRYGFFPSGGIAWSVSNEKFWQPLAERITNLRVRGTYGLVGNDAIGSDNDRFFYLSNVNMTDGARGAQFGRDYSYKQSGVSISRYANTDITWEKAYKTNLAIELGLFHKVQVQADFFTERRKNILMTRADIPTSMGLSAAVRANVGEASGRGMDLSIDYSESFSNNIWVQARGNLTYAKSRFEVYEEPEYPDAPWKSRVGLSLAQPMGYIAERLFVDDNEVANSPAQNFGTKVLAGDIKYKDVNRDGQITDLDKVPIGFPTTPEIVFGTGFSVGWKQFDLSAFFQGTARESFWISPANVQPFVSGGRQMIKSFADDYYTPERPDVYASWPRLSTVGNANNNQLSTWWLRNGAFFRFKQAEVGYTLPKVLAARMKMQSLRVYASGTNLFLWSKFKLWDVEMGGSGLSYPVQRVANLGLNVTF